MISPLRVGQHLELLKLIKTSEVVQIETHRCLPLLIDMKVHYHLCKMMIGQSNKKWDIGQLLTSHPLVYGAWHPYKYAVTTVYKLFQPLFKLLERVHTGLKSGDNVYLKPTLLHMEKSVMGLVLAAKDVRGRLNTRLQHLEGGHLLIGPEAFENWYTCAGLQLGWPQGPFPGRGTTVPVALPRPVPSCLRGQCLFSNTQYRPGDLPICVVDCRLKSQPGPTPHTFHH